MQMDKRNQIGCEDTTKLSAVGVRFDFREEQVASCAKQGEVELPSEQGGQSLSDLSGVKILSK